MENRDIKYLFKKYPHLYFSNDLENEYKSFLMEMDSLKIEIFKIEKIRDLIPKDFILKLKLLVIVKSEIDLFDNYKEDLILFKEDLEKFIKYYEFPKEPYEMVTTVK